MTLTKIVDGKTIVCSAEEEAAIRAEWLLNSAATAPSLDDYRRAIQAKIDATATDRSYDSSVTCASYAGSTNPIWAAEAAALIAWRDAVWAYAYSEMAKVQAGERAQPTVEAFVAELPAMSWPE